MIGLRLLQRSRFAPALIAGTTPPPATLPEAEWLLGLVASDGALRETPGDVNVRPYMSNYGAMGLARAAEVTGSTTYVDAAWDWCRWYANHMDPATGYVNDYTTIAGFSDNFDRADGPVGNGWTLWYGSTATIVSNTLVGDSSGAGIWRDLGSTDFDLSVDVAVTGAVRFEAYLGTLADVGASQTYYLLTLTNGGTLTFYRRTTGAGGDVSLSTVTVAPPSTATTVRIVRHRNALTAYVNGTLVLTATVTTPTSGTGTGLLVQAAVTLDNVTFTDQWHDSGAADSTDAYAGTYLLALWLTYYADSNVRYPSSHALDTLSSLADSLPLALTAITSTQQVDGLTWALPTYTVKYLEDNIESLVGLRASALMLSDLGLTSLQADFEAAADAMAHGLGYLWNESHLTWDYAIHENGVITPNDWTDENSQRQQIWAAGWGAHTTGTQGNYDSVSLGMDGYQAALPDWSSQTSSYEPMATWVLQRLGRTDALSTAIGNIEASIAAEDHAYPWTVATSGIFVFGKYGLHESMLEQIDFLGNHYPAQIDPAVDFPTGVNLLPNPTFVLDSNSDGAADGVGNYGAPTMALIPLGSGTGNVQRMTVPYDNGWDMRWDPILVIPGHYYTFSVYRRINHLEAAGDAVIKFELYDSGGGLVTYGYNIVNSTDATAVRWVVSTFIPPTAVSMRCIVGLEHGGTIDVAYPKLEDAASPTSWPSAPGFPATG